MILTFVAPETPPRSISWGFVDVLELHRDRLAAVDGDQDVLEPPVPAELRLGRLVAVPDDQRVGARRRRTRPRSTGPSPAGAPSCHAVSGSPSIAMPGWNFGRSPATDDAFALVSTSGTGVPGADAEPDGPLASGRRWPPRPTGRRRTPWRPSPGRARAGRGRPGRSRRRPAGRRPRRRSPRTGCRAFPSGVSRAVVVEARRLGDRRRRHRHGRRDLVVRRRPRPAPRPPGSCRTTGRRSGSTGWRSRTPGSGRGPPSSSSSSSGQAGTGGGVGSGSPYGAPHDAEASSGAAGSTGAGTAGDPGSPACGIGRLPFPRQERPARAAELVARDVAEAAALADRSGLVGHRRFSLGSGARVGGRSRVG